MNIPSSNSMTCLGELKISRYVNFVGEFSSIAKHFIKGCVRSKILEKSLQFFKSSITDANLPPSKVAAPGLPTPSAGPNSSPTCHTSVFLYLLNDSISVTSPCEDPLGSHFENENDLESKKNQ
ncbi:hypothetical protein TNCV_2921241 [Trichonephila clavipes]|nr:hypothetical protein TNCV_2921241 [Trichonephila clavipes]